MNEISKKQHFVFQSYLKGFSIEGLESDKMVWVYDKQFAKGEAPKIPKSVASICHSLFYYGQKPDGDDIFERKFQELESLVAPLIKRLNFEEGGNVEISGEDKGLLAFMIGLSMTRVPSFREPIEELHKKVVEIVLHNNYLGLKGPNGKDYHKFLEEYKVGVEVEKWVSLEPMIKIAQMIGEAILGKTWQFYKPPEGITYITSDNPVSFSYPSKLYGENPFVGPAHPLSEIVFPMRKDLVLVCTPQWPESHMKGFIADKQEVKKINRATAYAARKYIVSDIQSNALARLVLKNQGSEQTMLIS